MSCLAGYHGEMERALPEAGELRLHRNHLRLDQIRGQVSKLYLHHSHQGKGRTQKKQGRLKL